ncbi:HIT family protein [Falsarthrobacter nasiphocae]|uniref:Diadenosine tetraphosphate (Ap4A) HIT family hydrolase n=1 Tax=Falsarthrobacter nasiphocae TaxID=189863 RepID=A0AAE3YF83_9MICC|nr:diadenosine tetraphosphate hydrolase [Falsarthrobacter nasiphocae]MDR6891095.1 diadenosine tetraphosphate (Ap4A) HIT family hydrolase [Falsarthrobacter nasiphocae]
MTETHAAQSGDDWKADRIGAAIIGANPMVMARLPQSFAVIGDVQWLPGYSVLLTDTPGVERLTDLERTERLEFLSSLDRLAEAVEAACSEADSDFLRVNIEILGNKDPFLHAHVWPRYAWEPDDVRAKPVWLYPPTNWSEPAHAYGPASAGLREAITRRLNAPLGHDG